MNEVPIEEFKIVVKELLAYIDDLCQKNNIKYYVGHGSLIGAIRHGGFIPWDDDIDICMLRDDYERFFSLFPRENGRYYALTSQNAESYYDNFGRVCDRKCILKINGTEDVENFGAFVDVFPLDKVPEDYNERQNFYKELENAFQNLRYYGLPLRCYNTLTLKMKVKRFFKIKSFFKFQKIGTKKLKQIRDDIMTRYREDNSTPYVAVLFDKPGDYLLYNVEDLKPIIRHKFEDIEINIPKNYDKILRSQYGDYMKLPSKENRVTKHHFTAYWRE